MDRSGPHRLIVCKYVAGIANSTFGMRLVLLAISVSIRCKPDRRLLYLFVLIWIEVPMSSHVLERRASTSSLASATHRCTPPSEQWRLPHRYLPEHSVDPLTT